MTNQHYKAGDTVVRKDGGPGEWVVSSVTPDGYVFFNGYRGPFDADRFIRKETAS